MSGLFLGATGQTQNLLNTLSGMQPSQHNKSISILNQQATLSSKAAHATGINYGQPGMNSQQQYYSNHILQGNASSGGFKQMSTMKSPSQDLLLNASLSMGGLGNTATDFNNTRGNYSIGHQADTIFSGEEDTALMHQMMLTKSLNTVSQDEIHHKPSSNLFEKQQ